MSYHPLDFVKAGSYCYQAIQNATHGDWSITVKSFSKEAALLEDR